MCEWLVNKEELPIGVVEFQELLCGCGKPQICWDALYDYLQRTKFYCNTENPFELFFMYAIGHLGLTEHGTSIYNSWITDKGKQVLDWLDINIDKAGDLVICY